MQTHAIAHTFVLVLGRAHSYGLGRCFKSYCSGWMKPDCGAPGNVGPDTSTADVNFSSTPIHSPRSYRPNRQDVTSHKVSSLTCACDSNPEFRSTMRRPPPVRRKLINALPNLIPFVVLFSHVLLAPYTKVEESFTLHAVHDVLVYGLNSESYAHVRLRAPASAIVPIIAFLQIPPTYESPQCVGDVAATLTDRSVGPCNLPGSYTEIIHPAYFTRPRYPALFNAGSRRGCHPDQAPSPNPQYVVSQLDVSLPNWRSRTNHQTPNHTMLTSYQSDSSSLESMPTASITS